VPMHSVYTTLSPPLHSRLLPAGTYEFQITGVAAPYSFRLLNAATAPFYTPGTLTTNDISPSSGALLRRVILAAGQELYFDTLSESGFGASPSKQLYGPAGNLLFNFTGAGDSGAFTVNQTGEYDLVFDGQWQNTNPTGTLAFNLRSVINTTNSLTFGSTISSTLAGGADQHHYTFTLATTNRVFFDALAYSASGWQWSLTGPSGLLVQNRGFAGSDGIDIGDSSLRLVPGNYRLSVSSGSDQPVPYQFRLLRDLDATPFTLGSTVTTNHTPTTITSLFRFNSAAGQPVYFDSIPSGGYAPGMRLYSPDGFLLSSFGANSDLDTFVLPVGGDYLLSIEGRIYDTRPTGAVSFAFLPVTNTTNALALNQLAAGNIIVPGTRQNWVFSLATPTTLFFDALTNTPNATWTLTRGENVLVPARGLLGSDGLDFADSMLRLTAGDYVLTVALGLNNTGGYAFRLLSPASATPLLADVATAVQLDPPVETRLLTFAGVAGDPYYFDGRPLVGGGSISARFYDPTGRQLFSRGGNDDEPSFVLPYSGTYLLAVEGRIYNTGPAITANFALISNPAKPVEPLFEDSTLPDLLVTAVSVAPGAGLKSGDPFTVNWTVRNEGQLATGGSFADRVVVRNTTLNQIILNTTLAYTPADAGNGPITPGTQRNRQLALTLPAGASGAGSLEVTVTTDTANQIAEYKVGGTGEANNSRVANFSSTLAPYPDLRVLSLAAVPPNGWAAGGTVQFNWGITNSGPASASTSWVDRVIVRNVSRSVVLLSTNVAHDFVSEGALAPAGRRNRTAQFIVPNGANGQGVFEISVESDALAHVVESQSNGSGEDNNLSLITVRSAPDLQVTGVTVTPSPSAQSGASLLVAWTLANNGSAPVETAFSDRVLVRNPGNAATLLNTTTVYNPAIQGSGAILPGTSRSRSLTIKLPDGPSAVGALQIEVGADTFNQVFELTAVASGEDNNLATANLNTTLAPYPDLLAANVTVTPAAPQTGQEITIRWEDVNTGDAPAAGNWY
ncbi:MAG TPA: CARDB domain-containing protein, partial [Verrucomicrobiae bacterium]|nr:CARDB domain-containing protein [Verrucomicrobiae bacterium]